MNSNKPGAATALEACLLKPTSHADVPPVYESVKLFGLIKQSASSSKHKLLILSFRQDNDSDDTLSASVRSRGWAVCDGSEVAKLVAPFPTVCLALNILMPGSGTMLSAFNRFHQTKSHEPVNWATFVDGILQQLLSVILLGWVWSVLFGLSLYKKA